MARRSRVLVTAVTVLLLMTAVPLVTAARVDAAPPTAWTGSGPGVISVISDGTSSSPQFSYSENNTTAVYSTQTWTFSTVADADGPVTVPYSYTGFHAYYNVRVFLDAFVTHAGVTTVTHLVTAGPATCCTPPSGGFSYVGSANFSLANGDSYGFMFGGSNYDSTLLFYGTLLLASPPPFQDPVAVAANTSWPNAALLTSAGLDGTVTQPGEARWFKFPIVPESQIQVDLSNLDQNFDLTLFRDIGQAFTTLTSTNDLTHLSAEFAGDAFSPSAYSPGIYSPGIYSPGIYSPGIYSPGIYSPGIYSPSQAFIDAFSSAQTRSLIGVSARDGSSDESIRAATWNNTGFFYVRVQGRNGASSATPFHLTLTNTGGPCSGAPLSPRLDLATITGTPGAARTVILTDSLRLGLTGVAATAFATKLGQLATATQGVVVDVRTSPRITALNLQADTNAACPYAKNLVAQSIRDVVNSFRDTSNTLKYVVIAGGDAVIPFFRYPDAAGLGPESDYVPPVIDTSPSQASLRLNNVLGQDAYGALADLTVKGATLPVPDLAVGRLVETPSEITGMVDDYLALPGGKLPTAHSSLVTGYDFLTSAADAVETDFSVGLGAGGINHQLITNQGVPTTTTTGPGGPSRTTSWTATDLSNMLFGSHHDLIFLAGHFSANSALAADYKTSIVTTDVAAHPGLFRDSLVFSAGCHSGYNLLDGDGVPGVTLGLDWTQVMAQQRATLIAGTGYQYADTDFLAYSAKLYTQVAHQLRSGVVGTPVAIGQALVNAKQDYLAGLANVSGIDLKSVLESTLYGLPMIGLDLPGRATPPVLPPAVVTSSVDAGTPGAVLGLRTALLNVATPTAVQQKAVLDLNAVPVVPATNFRWLTGSDGNQTAPALPALPQQIQDVTSATAGEVLRGVGFVSSDYTDTTGVTPLTGAPTTEQNGVHTTFASPVFFPQKLWTVNYFDALGGSGTDGRTRVVMTPAQYRLDAGSTATDTERAHSRMGLRLYYSGNTSTYGGNTPALAAPPSISGVTSAVSAATTVTVSAHVTGDPSAGIQQVWVSYTGEQGPFHGQWRSVDLTQNAFDSTLWTGTVGLPTDQPPGDVRFVLQAVNGVGLVSLDNNQGDGYTPAVLVGNTPPTAAPTTLALDASIASSASNGSTLSVGATLSDAPVGSEVNFALGTAFASAITDGTGHATAVLALQDAPGSFSLTASYAGDTTHTASDATKPNFAITKAATTLTLAAVPPVGGGTGIATGLTATLLRATGAPISQRTVYFVLVGPTGTLVVPAITDSLGRATLGPLVLPVGTQSVTARFLGPVPLPGGTVTFTDPIYLESSATTSIVVSPLEVLRSAQASLRQLTGLTTKQTVTVGLAVVALQGALLSTHWISGGTRLDKQGDPVQLLVNGAVKLLVTVTPKVPTVTAAISSLVGVDKALAQNAIADAVAAHGNAAKINLARAALASGDTAVTKGTPDKAVDFYRSAWLLAQSAY